MSCKVPVCGKGSVSYEIKALDHIIQRHMMASVMDTGIDRVTVMHGWIIEYLYDHINEDVYQKDIESEFSISRSTVTSILKLMEKKKYINRLSVKNDARLKKIVLTETGRKINSVFRKAIEQNENCIDHMLTDDEQRIFIELIRKLKTNLENKQYN